jgi:hypothetical protein
MAEMTSVKDPDPGPGAFLTPRSGMGKKSGTGYGMNNPDHIFWVKYLNSLMRIRKFGIFLTLDPGSGMEKILICLPETHPVWWR